MFRRSVALRQLVATRQTADPRSKQQVVVLGVGGNPYVRRCRWLCAVTACKVRNCRQRGIFDIDGAVSCYGTDSCLALTYILLYQPIEYSVHCRPPLDLILSH